MWINIIGAEIKEFNLKYNLKLLLKIYIMYYLIIITDIVNKFFKI